MLRYRAEGLVHQRYLRCLAAHFTANPVKPRLGEFQRLGVPVKSDQAPLRPQQPDNSFGVPRQTQRAIHIRTACAHFEKIDRFLKKNWHMAFIRFRHALPLGGLAVIAPLEFVR